MLITRYKAKANRDVYFIISWNNFFIRYSELCNSNKILSADCHKQTYIYIATNSEPGFLKTFSDSLQIQAVWTWYMNNQLSIIALQLKLENGTPGLMSVMGTLVT